MPPKTSTSPYSPPKSDAYTGLLVVSLFALMGGSAVLYLDWSQYSKTKPPTPSSAGAPRQGGPAPGGAAQGAQGAQGAMGQMGGQAMGQMGGQAMGQMGGQAMGQMGGQAMGMMGAKGQAMGVMGGKP
jgi:hypothetical protein